MFSNRQYDLAKRLVTVILPAFGALYFGLSQIWGLPAGEPVVGTVALITTFLGVALNISHSAYENSDAAFDGKVIPIQDGGRTGYSFQLDEGVAKTLDTAGAVRFRVCPPGSIPVEQLRYEPPSDEPDL